MVGGAIRGVEVSERSGVEKGPSDTPVIDQKFMSETGITPACPVSFHVKNQGWGWGGGSTMVKGRTSEIATFSKTLSPHGQGWAYGTQGHQRPAG